MPPPVTWPAWSASSGPSRLTTTSATLLSGKIHPPAAPAAGRPTWPPSAQPSARPSRTPATCTSPKADATTPPRPKPSASTASIRTDADIHGTRRSPALPAARAIQQCASWRTDAVLHVACAPGMLRRDARGRVTVLELGGLVERDSRPDQVVRIVRQPGQRERGQLGPQVLPAPPAGAQQGLHPVRVLVPGSPGKLPAVRLHPRRQPPRVIRRRRDGAALRHHPPEHRADLRVHS